jgi:hypothetical protein
MMDRLPTARPDPDLSVPRLTDVKLDLLDETIPEAYKIAQRNRLSCAEVRFYLKTTRMVVFVYGSLQLPNEIALCLNHDKAFRDDEDVGFALRMTPGKLTHHRLYAIKDRIFPAVLDNGTEDDIVDGMVIFGLMETQRQRFDRFEGGWYSREAKQVVIQLASGDEENIDADVYIWAHGSHYLIDPAEKKWSLSEFIQERKKAPGVKPTDFENDKHQEEQGIYRNPVDESQGHDDDVTMMSSSEDEERQQRIRAIMQSIADHRNRERHLSIDSDSSFNGTDPLSDDSEASSRDALEMRFNDNLAEQMDDLELPE